MLFTPFSNVPFADLLEDIITSPLIEPNLPAYWRKKEGNVDVGKVLQEINDEKKFAIAIDVSHFHPREIQASLEDKKLLISAKSHRGTEANSFDCQFSRSWLLPADVSATHLKSTLSEEGILTIEAAKTIPPREIPIQIVNKE